MPRLKTANCPFFAPYGSDFFIFFLLFTFAGFLIISSGCTRELDLVEDPTEQILQESLAKILDYNSGVREEKLAYCRLIDSIARTCPENYADYLVAANALAATNWTTFDEWEFFISKGETAYSRLRGFLSEKYILRTKILTKYERCRKLDVMGEIDRALECYDEVWQELPEQHQEAEFLVKLRKAISISMAHLYQFIGSYKRSEDWIGILQRELNDEKDIYLGLNFQLKGRLAEILGEEWEAKNNYRKAHDFYTSFDGNPSPFLMENIIQLSNLYLNEGKVDSANLVLNLVEDSDSLEYYDFLYYFYQKAKVNLVLGRFKIAAQHGRKALSQAEKIMPREKNYWKARILTVIGESLAREGHWRSSLDTLQQAFRHLSGEEVQSSWSFNPSPRSSDTKLDLLKTLVLKAEILSDHYYAANQDDPGLLEASLGTYKTSIRLIKILREEYNDDEVKEYLSRGSFSTFEAALQTALKLYSLNSNTDYLQDAFAIFESSKALSLFENLKEIEARKVAGLPEELIQRERELKFNIGNQEMKIRDLAEGPDRELLAGLLAQTRSDYEDLIELLKNNHSQYFKLKYSSETIGISKIQQLLSPEESLIEFFYGEQNIYTFLITQTSQDVFTIPKTEEFETLLGNFIEDLSSHLGLNNSRKIRQYLKSGNAIYRQLLEPLDIRTPKLIIIPDGKLHFLPFSALPTDTAFINDPGKLPYLLKRHSIRRNFSASVWQQQEFSTVRKKNKTGSLLVIAPEKFPDDSKLSLDPKKLQAEFNQAVQVETNPTKERVRELFGQDFDNIFIFTHASAKDDNPYMQLLDDSLFLNELYVTRITANLVLLSACETGLGKNQQGEGVLSLGRGFAYQNVPNTIMTLWKVQDSAALWISTEMLKLHLFEGLPPSEALRRAQIKWINEHEEDSTPFHWAGFISTGR